MSVSQAHMRREREQERDGEFIRISRLIKFLKSGVAGTPARLAMTLKMPMRRTRVREKERERSLLTINKSLKVGK